MKIYSEPPAGFGTRIYELIDRARSGQEYLAVRVDEPLQCMLTAEAICKTTQIEDFSMHIATWGIRFYLRGNMVGSVDFYTFDDTVPAGYDWYGEMYEVDGQMRIFDQEGNENE